MRSLLWFWLSRCTEKGGTWEEGLFHPTPSPTRATCSPASLVPWRGSGRRTGRHWARRPRGFRCRSCRRTRLRPPPWPPRLPPPYPERRASPRPPLSRPGFIQAKWRRRHALLERRTMFRWRERKRRSELWNGIWKRWAKRTWICSNLRGRASTISRPRFLQCCPPPTPAHSTPARKREMARKFAHWGDVLRKSRKKNTNVGLSKFLFWKKCTFEGAHAAKFVLYCNRRL